MNSFARMLIALAFVSQLIGEARADCCKFKSPDEKIAREAASGCIAGGVGAAVVSGGSAAGLGCAAGGLASAIASGTVDWGFGDQCWGRGACNMFCCNCDGGCVGDEAIRCNAEGGCAGSAEGVPGDGVTICDGCHSCTYKNCCHKSFTNPYTHCPIPGWRSAAYRGG